MIKNTSDGVIGVHVRPLKPSEVILNVNDITQSYVCKETRFYNGTKYDLTVVDRTGVLIHNPKSIGISNGVFTIRVAWHIQRGYIDEFLKNMEGYQYLNNEELNYLMQSAINQRRHYTDVCAILDYEIKESEFNEHKQSVYVTNQDLVVSTIRPDRTPAHPFTQTTVDKKQKLSGDFEDLASATIKLVYVDNTGLRGDRYANLCGQVQKLTPKTDINASDGIFIYTRQKKINSTSDYYVAKTMVTLEDAEKVLGIYKTYEEALYGGDPKNGIKLRILEVENSVTQAKNDLALKNIEVERLSADNKTQEMQYKTLLADHQRATELLKASEENKRLLQSQILLTKKHEADMQKQDFEMRSTWRKDAGDMLKFVVPLIIAVAGATTAVVKMKTS